MLLIVVMQVLLPLMLIAALALRRPRGRSATLIETITVATYLAAIAAAGVWLRFPRILLIAYWVLLALAGVRAVQRAFANGDPSEPRVRRVGLAGRVTVAVAAAALALYALSGRRVPAPMAATLEFPLREGVYLVANGGGNELVNAHLMTLTDERFRAYRGQSYGVDIVRIDHWGRRARGIAPSDPRAYLIFGDKVYAPCEGRVITAFDGLPDLRPPQVDRSHMAGNHVVLECSGQWVVMGHFSKGSVRVDDGDWVPVGAHIANVGNTGNSNEPHLHIHVQRPGPAQAPLGGDPVPVRFGDRYLVRNARVESAVKPRGTIGPHVENPIGAGTLADQPE